MFPKKIKILSFLIASSALIFPKLGQCNQDELNPYRLLVQFKEKKPQDPTKIYTFYEEPSNEGNENKPEDFQYTFFKNEGFTVPPTITITEIFEDDNTIKYHYKIEFTDNQTINTTYTNTPNQYHETQEKSIFTGETTQKFNIKTGKGETTSLNFENPTKNQSKITYAISIRLDKKPLTKN